MEERPVTKVTTDFLEQQQLEQNLNGIYVAILATFYGYSSMFLDIFSSAGGILSSVDTGNTTAYFLTNLYDNGGVIDFSNAAVVEEDNDAYVLKKTFEDLSGTTPNVTNQIRSSSPAEIGYCKVKYYYSDETTEEVEQSQYGDTWTSKTYTNPYSAKGVDKIEVYLRTSSSGIDAEEKSTAFTITRVPTKKIVQMDMRTIAANPVACRIYCHYSLAGTSSLTYDISFDNGTTWVTDQSLNIKNTSVHDGTQMILRLNLNGEGTGNRATVSDYSMMLYY